MCARRGFPRLGEARGCQLAAGAPPSGPCPESSGPSFPSRSPSPAGQALGRPGGASGSGSSELGGARVPRCPRARAPSCPRPRPVVPAPLPLRATPCQNFVAAAARAASGAGRRTGGGGRAPGRAGRGRRGARERRPRPAALPCPSSAAAAAAARRRAAAASGRRGSRRRGRPRGQRAGSPSRTREARSRSRAATARRRSGTWTKSSRPWSTSRRTRAAARPGGKEAPAADPGTRPGARSPALAFCVSFAGGEAPAACPGRFPEATGPFCRRYVRVRCLRLPAPQLGASARVALGSPRPGGRAPAFRPGRPQPSWGAGVGALGFPVPTPGLLD